MFDHPLLRPGARPHPERAHRRRPANLDAARLEGGLLPGLARVAPGLGGGAAADARHGRRRVPARRVPDAAGARSRSSCGRCARRSTASQRAAGSLVRVDIEADAPTRHGPRPDHAPGGPPARHRRLERRAGLAPRRPARAVRRDAVHRRGARLARARPDLRGRPDPRREAGRVADVGGAQIVVVADEDAVARESARRDRGRAGSAAVDERGVAHIALTGGSSAVPLYPRAAQPGRAAPRSTGRRSTCGGATTASCRSTIRSRTPALPTSCCWPSSERAGLSGEGGQYDDVAAGDVPGPADQIRRTSTRSRSTRRSATTSRSSLPRSSTCGSCSAICRWPRAACRCST